MSTLFDKMAGAYIEDTNGLPYPELVIIEEEIH